MHDVSSTKTEIDPNKLPRRNAVLTRSGRPWLRDAWFVAMPLLVLAFYVHSAIFLMMKGVTTVSPILPEGNPGHVSWAVAWWLFAETGAVGIVWFGTVAWICAKVWREPSIRYKIVCGIAAFVLSPIICPLIYFRMLRRKTTANTDQPHSPPSPDQPAADG